MRAKHIPIAILAGPTGIGKTGFAVKLAHRWNTEIISADSMQVYKQLTIGTAKPRPGELEGIPYHLIDHVDIRDRYDLARFIREADEIIGRLRSQGKRPLVVGGTGLYIKGLLEGIFETDSKDMKIRETLQSRVIAEGLESLYEELKSVDPRASARIKPGDRQRIVRALEVFYTTGAPISTHQKESQRSSPRYKHMLVVMFRERQELYERIETRVDRMFTEGLVGEVEGLLDAGFSPDLHPLKALGYREVMRYLEGRWSLERARSEMKKATRRFAKRQLTWFRAVPEARWLNISRMPGEEVLVHLDEIFTGEK